MRVIAVSLLLAGLLASTGSAALAQGEVTGTGYRVGARDLLEVQVPQITELVSVERRVGEDGKINLPLLGDVIVVGLTDVEVRDRIRLLLEAKFVQPGAATVSVLLKEFRSRPISVIGAVKQPGPLAFPGRWTLLEALTAAGGLTPDHGEIILILRRASNGLTDQISVDVDDLLLRGVERANLPIFANDLINVPAASTITIFFVGEVRNPGAISFKSTERISMLTALARAGGLSDRASRTVVVRRQIGNRQQEIEIDAKKLLAGRTADIELRDGDVVVVKEAFF